MTHALLHDPGVQKILIEPHLKERLQLQSSKVRFQGSRAARHDDHVHVCKFSDHARSVDAFSSYADV